MTYPRHPGDILKDLRNEQGLSAAQAGQRLMRAAGWPRTRWDNIEKHSQSIDGNGVLDLVKAGIIQNTDPRYAELKDWEDYEEKVKDQSYQNLNERFASREDFRHWLKTGRVPIDPLTTPIDQPQPPAHDPAPTEKEELPSAFPDKPAEAKPEPPPTAKPRRDHIGISNSALKKAFYGVGIIAGLVVIIWFGSLTVNLRGNNQPTPIPEPASTMVTVVKEVVEVVVTATPDEKAGQLVMVAKEPDNPKPVEAAQGQAEEQEVQPASSAPTPVPAPAVTYCHISFRQGVPGQVPCQGQGQIVISKVRERADLNWAGCISNMTVPPGWRVAALYETWLPPDYSKADPERTGWVEFPEGNWRMDQGGLQVYHDPNLSNPKRTAEAGEVNDRIQEIVIYPQGGGTLVLNENTPPDVGMELHLTWQ